MKSKSVKIPSAIAPILRDIATDGCNALITEQLQRADYVAVNKVLEALGGKWNRSARAHVFPRPAREILDDALGNGQTDVLDTKATFGQFNTPPELAERVIAAADIKPGHRILEPSAGTGALLAPLDPDIICGEIVAIESHSALAIALRDRFPHVDVYFLDFLTCGIEGGHSLGPRGQFDRIVMNPPFAESQDVRHVWHALRFLKPGGRLVAIMSAGVTCREDRFTRAFRAMVDDMDGTIEPLPAGAFKASGTDVRAVLVTIDL